MAQNERKRQQKLAKQKKKRQEKQQSLARQGHENSSLSLVLDKVDSLPVELCERYFVPSIPDAIDAIWVARRVPGGRTLVASFLIDRLCLGVKDAYIVLSTAAEADQDIARRRSRATFEDLELADALQYIDGAVDFAARAGIAPHKSFSQARRIFGKTEPSREASPWTYGREGKPCFIQGPNDDSRRAREILDTLRATCGEDNYEFTVRLGPDDSEFENLELADDHMDDEGAELENRAETNLRLLQKLISENEDVVGPVRRAIKESIAEHEREEKSKHSPELDSSS
jgi:hypothetical protein